MIIETRPIQKDEFIRLIKFDSINLQKVMEKIGVPTKELAPLLTLAELDQAYARKDILEWVVIDKNQIGYFWFERRINSLNISGVAIKEEFQGKGIIQYILNLADNYAKENNLLKCELSVHPLNGRALNVYLKAGYKIIASIPAFFGPKYPSTFRLVLEKDLSKNYKMQLSGDILEIFCCDYDKLKYATDNGYVGVQLIQASDKNNFHNKVRFNKFY